MIAMQIMEPEIIRCYDALALSIARKISADQALRLMGVKRNFEESEGNGNGNEKK